MMVKANRKKHEDSIIPDKLFTDHVDGSVKRWFDKSIIGDVKKQDNVDEEAHKQSVSEMGQNRAIEKSQRVFYTQSLVITKKVKNYTQLKLALREKFNQSLNKSTIVGYLKLAGIRLLDDTDAKDKVYLNPEGLTATQYRQSIESSYKYYSADPAKGGYEITYEEYTKQL